MAAFKFKIGETVAIFLPSAKLGAKAERFTVIRQLPSLPGRREYRVRHVADGHERVIEEENMRTIIQDGMPDAAS